MSEQNPELIRRITDEVLKAVSSMEQAPAAIKPPAGVCTGDYSKFTELKAKPQEQFKSEPSGTTVVPLTGIVTASQLSAVISSSSEGAAVLAEDARLSPLARDYVREHPGCVRYAGSAPSPTSGGTQLSWMWWIDGACPAVESVLGSHRDRLVASTAGRLGSALPRVVRDLALAVKARRVAGAILFVPSAAKAVCYANRCASLRAVVGTCGEAVEQGINEIGANVLVIEYPHHGRKSIAAMVERMLQQPPKAPAMVDRDLNDLHRCG
ncbi:MAG: hypothetical protein GC164_09755 [Phycisphaera sp.]|nr:hypothetical protein [Phycisphaera sp.]